MFLFIDIMPRTKELKIIEDTCPGCRKHGHVRIVKNFNRLRLFFIPIFSWGSVYTLMHGCENTMRISEDDAIALMHVGASLDQITVNITEPSIRICPNCGRVLKENFIRCPYCRE